MISRKLYLVLALVAALLMACSFTQAATPTPTTAPTPTVPTLTPATTSSPTPTETLKIIVIFVNDTATTICNISYYPPDFQGGMMPNALRARLAAGETVEAALDPGTYNFDVWDCQGNKLKSVTSYQLTEPLTWNLSETPAGSAAGTLYINIVNQRSYDFCEFYVSPAGSGDWGENRLFPDYGFIVTSNSSYLEWIEPGTYDLMLKDCSGNVAAQEFNLTIPSNMTWTLTP